MILSVFEEIEERIINRINSSERSVFVAVAWFTNQLLLESLVTALKRNVVVNVLILNDILNRSEFGLDFGVLSKLGAEIRFAKSDLGTMHNKFCIIDNLVITGSYNWTYHANRNNENILITDEESVVNGYKEEFDRLFGDATEIPLPYEHLKWTEIKEGDFSELRRNIFRDVTARNDENRELKRNKLINLDHAYKSGDSEELVKASLLATEQNYSTITDVLTRDHNFKLSLWEENESGEIHNNVVGYYQFEKWEYCPCCIEKDVDQREYVVGIVDLFDNPSSLAKRPHIKVYDKKFVETIKKKIAGDETIPIECLCIEYGKFYFYPFKKPMYNINQPKIQNGRQRLIHGINVFAIAKEVNGDNVLFYDGWDPYTRGELIANTFFCGQT